MKKKMNQLKNLKSIYKNRFYFLFMILKQRKNFFNFFLIFKLNQI